MDDTLLLKAGKLKACIEGLSDFQIIPPDIPYHHMGATICDAMLQAGLTWESVVKPRLDRLKNEYPDANTTSNFFKLTKEKNIKEIIDWQDDEKPQRIIGVTIFFVEESIETEADLKAWLEEEGNVHRLKQLRGIGNKTADYFKLLAGIQTAAIDVHLMNFLKKAGIYPGSYREAQEIIHETTDLMGLNRATIDHSIWKYMSQRRNTRECGRAKKTMASRYPIKRESI